MNVQLSVSVDACHTFSTSLGVQSPLQETLPNGAIYVGQWKGDLRDGFGKQARVVGVERQSCAE